MYPPGKFGQKNLPMFTFIHGGPNDADGNHFEADWYQWDRLAATQGWLIFEPNYRGSTGYGDDFLRGHVTQRIDDCAITACCDVVFYPLGINDTAVFQHDLFLTLEEWNVGPAVEALYRLAFEAVN